MPPVAEPSEREIALIAKMPEDISCTGPVVVVDFYDPALMAYGEEQVSIRRRIQNGVGVSPVRKHVRFAVDVQMVERIPEPHGIQVRVEVDERIA